MTRPVYVAGVGLHRYQRSSEASFVTLGLAAVRAALADAGAEWSDVQGVYTGTTRLGMAVSRPMLRHLGATGVAMTQVENASASSSSAFRLACMEVSSGEADIVLAMGVDKPGPSSRAESRTGLTGLADGHVVPFTRFAMLANEYMHRHGATPEQVAAVAVKNHRNGARNPYAHHQKERDLAEVLDAEPVAGTLTKWQCCPVGEGASAVVVASEDALARLGGDPSRAVRVRASAQRSERLYGDGDFDVEITRETTAEALHRAAVRPADLDVIELHDAFAIEELRYVEAMGLCADGQAAGRLADGEFDVGGRCAVSPSGGLIAMGHPIGPTGTGQIAEVARQLRGEAGDRQQPGARLGLAHMVGVGAVCVVHVLEAAE
ncbi:acetyl-CoA acetyltransferase [Lipingzhangella halophila]|uniref:Acetyl-CoA acetyltransferase n=1 Tax=Lipingzhangella halophila TaxID=1783352 RepID=A0A7W7RMY8_9ACTN|nr:thiolase family protein [Lipingzhangella halophila]MBB4934968.1 acetyl-CoA acetyltransferase [Lipingzhangella halophila]